MAVVNANPSFGSARDRPFIFVEHTVKKTAHSCSRAILLDCKAPTKHISTKDAKYLVSKEGRELFSREVTILKKKVRDESIMRIKLNSFKK